MYAMRILAAIALVFCGTLLILAPAAYSLCQQQMILNAAVAHVDVSAYWRTITLNPVYTLGCWMLGAVMIGIATLVVLLSRTQRKDAA